MPGKLPTFTAVYRRMTAALKARARVVEALQEMARWTKRAHRLKGEGKLAEAREALAKAERWRKVHERLSKPSSSR
jgi:regulator of protease activity HflC (stomatin/prohibitin superfamily)